MKNHSRWNNFRNIVVLPVLMGLGHLAPCLGAIKIATGSYQYPVALLGMIGSGAALVDSYDTYKDIPLSSRPRKWLWRCWIYSLWTVVLTCTFYSGLQTAIQLYRFSLIGLCWGTPCIPSFSWSSGFNFFKPKTVLREAKSLVVAVCMGYVTADTSMFYFCHARDSPPPCSEHTLRTRSLCLAILYQFFRETACDTRDISEDAKDGMKTLPVRLGKTNTLLLMASLGTLLESLITNGISMTWAGIHVSTPLLSGSVFRVTMLLIFYAMILQYPKGSLAWGWMSLLGLIPVLWAQAALLE